MDVLVEQHLAAGADALPQARQERFQVRQEHRQPAAPGEIELLLGPGILQQIVLADLQLIDAASARQGLGLGGVVSAELQAQDTAAGSDEGGQIGCSKTWTGSEVEQVLPAVDAGPGPSGLADG